MDKILDLNQIEKISKDLKNQGKLIVLVGGCFDILHEGHFQFLRAAKKEGDVLVVALENDARVRHLKGEGRPVNPERLRAKNLAEVAEVDYIIILPFSGGRENYLEMVRKIRPNIIAVTAGDPKIERKEEQANLVGGKVKVVIERLPGLSTTEIVNGL